MCCFSSMTCCSGCVEHKDCNDPRIADINMLCDCDGTCGSHECGYIEDCSTDFSACDQNEVSTICCNGVCT